MGMINAEVCLNSSSEEGKGGCGQEDVTTYNTNLVGIVLFLNQRGRYTGVQCMS